MEWEDLETNFIEEFTLSEDFDKCHVLLEMTLIIHPLGVFHDHGGDCQKFFAVLPKTNWACYFGDKIKCSYTKLEGNEDNFDCSDAGGLTDGNEADDEVHG